MTYREMEHEKIVDEAMFDAGFLDEPELRAALTSLESFAGMPAPRPGVELAALLTGTTDEPAKLRQLRGYRPAVVGAAVLTAMGLGVGAVAAAGAGFNDKSDFVNRLMATWAPAWVPVPPSFQPQLPQPDAPRITTGSVPLVDPVTVPSVAPVQENTPVPDSAADPAPDSGRHPGNGDGKGRNSDKPGWYEDSPGGKVPQPSKDRVLGLSGVPEGLGR